VITTDELSSLFKVNFMALRANLDSVNHQESLVKLHSGGNHLNWVLGHILISRAPILEMLAKDKVISDIQGAPYKRGVQPGDNDILMPLDELKKRLVQSQKRILDGLKEISDDQLREFDPDHEIPWRQKPMGDQLIFLHFHEAYHIGQVGLLRRIIGKECAIK